MSAPQTPARQSVAQPSPGHLSPAHAFRMVLRPHRSLSERGFLVLMAAVSVVSFVTGIAFLMIGAWPVLGFFGLDVAIIYLAFRFNYRSARRSETIVIADHALTLTRTDPAGHTETIPFNPYWVRVALAETHDGRTNLALASHGRVHEIGSFLSDDERRDAADALKGALVSARGGPRI